MFIIGFLAGDLVNRENGPTAAQKKFQTILNLVRNEYVDEVNLDSLIEKTIPSLQTTRPISLRATCRRSTKTLTALSAESAYSS